MNTTAISIFCIIGAFATLGVSYWTERYKWPLIGMAIGFALIALYLELIA